MKQSAMNFSYLSCGEDDLDYILNLHYNKVDGGHRDDFLFMAKAVIQRGRIQRLGQEGRTTTTLQHQGATVQHQELQACYAFNPIRDLDIVLSALFIEDQQVVTVHYDATADRLYFAERGRGSFVDVVCLRSIADREIVVINGTDLETLRGSAHTQHMMQLYGEPGDLTQMGKDGRRLYAGLATGSRQAALLLSQCGVVINGGSGLLHVYDLGMKLNVEEAGGVVTRYDGSVIDFTTPGTIGDLLCTSSREHHDYTLNLIHGRNFN